MFFVEVVVEGGVEWLWLIFMMVTIMILGMVFLVLGETLVGDVFYFLLVCVVIGGLVVLIFLILLLVFFFYVVGEGLCRVVL